MLICIVLAQIPGGIYKSNLKEWHNNNIKQFFLTKTS